MSLHAHEAHLSIANFFSVMITLIIAMAKITQFLEATYRWINSIASESPYQTGLTREK